MAAKTGNGRRLGPVKTQHRIRGCNDTNKSHAERFLIVFHGKKRFGIVPESSKEYAPRYLGLCQPLEDGSSRITVWPSVLILEFLLSRDYFSSITSAWTYSFYLVNVVCLGVAKPLHSLHRQGQASLKTSP